MSGCRRALRRWHNSIQAVTARWKSVNSKSNRFVSRGARARGGCHSAPPKPAATPKAGTQTAGAGRSGARPTLRRRPGQQERAGERSCACGARSRACGTTICAGAQLDEVGPQHGRGARVQAARARLSRIRGPAGEPGISVFARLALSPMPKAPSKRHSRAIPTTPSPTTSSASRSASSANLRKPKRRISVRSPLNRITRPRI